MKDPIVEEVHRHREERAKKFKHNLGAMFEDLKTKEAEARKRGVKFVVPKKRKSS